MKEVSIADDLQTATSKRCFASCVRFVKLVLAQVKVDCTGHPPRLFPSASRRLSQRPLRRHRRTRSDARRRSRASRFATARGEPALVSVAEGLRVRSPSHSVYVCSNRCLTRRTAVTRSRTRRASQSTAARTQLTAEWKVRRLSMRCASVQECIATSRLAVLGLLGVLAESLHAVLPRSSLFLLRLALRSFPVSVSAHSQRSRWWAGAHCFFSRL